MYYLQVREEPLLPPVEDFQVPPSICVVLGCWVSLTFADATVFVIYPGTEGNA